MGEAQWYWNWNEFQSQAPSLKSITLDQELSNRRMGCEFIERLGLSLGLTQIPISTAQLFFHRFYMRESFQRYNLHEMALAMTFLGAKVEESARKLKNVLLKGAEIRFKTAEALQESSPEFNRLYERVLQLERLALVQLCFDLTVDHPFRHILKLFADFPGSFDEEKLANGLWCRIISSYRTPLCVLFKPRPLSLALLLIHITAAADSLESRQLLRYCQSPNTAAPEWSTTFPKVSSEEVQEVLDFLRNNSQVFCISM